MRCFAERGRELLLHRRKPGRQRLDPPNSGSVSLSRKRPLARRLPTRSAMAATRRGAGPLGPGGDRALHQVGAVEVAVQADHSADVVLVIAAKTEALARNVQVGIRLVELDARLVIAGGNRQRGVEALAILGLPADDKGLQRLHGLGPAFRPEALAADESAHSGQDLESGDGQHRQRDHRDHERRQDPQMQRPTLACRQGVACETGAGAGPCAGARNAGIDGIAVAQHGLGRVDGLSLPVRPSPSRHQGVRQRRVARRPQPPS